MKKILSAIIIMISTIFIFITTVNAASINISSAIVDKNVSVTVNFGQKVGAATIDLKYDASKFTYVSVSNGKANNSNGNVRVVYFDSTGGDNPIGGITFTFKAKQVGDANFSASVTGMATPDSSKKLPNATANKSVKIEKEPEKPKTETPAETPTKTQTTNNKTTTTNKKTEQNKTQTQVVETQEKEEATPLWGINEVKLIGIKENGEKVDLKLDKAFNITAYEYLCNVSSDIIKIEVQKEAYEYNEFVTITGTEEELKEGENIITLRLAKEGQKELIYTIKVNKEAKPQEVLTSAEVLTDEVKEEKMQTYICIPMWKFVLMQIILISIIVAITLLVKKIINNKTIRKDNNKDEINQ